jgi:hypothetical protein
VPLRYRRADTPEEQQKPDSATSGEYDRGAVYSRSSGVSDEPPLPLELAPLPVDMDDDENGTSLFRLLHSKGYDATSTKQLAPLDDEMVAGDKPQTPQQIQDSQLSGEPVLDTNGKRTVRIQEPDGTVTVPSDKSKPASKTPKPKKAKKPKSTVDQESSSEEEDDVEEEMEDNAVSTASKSGGSKSLGLQGKSGIQGVKKTKSENRDKTKQRKLKTKKPKNTDGSGQGAEQGSDNEDNDDDEEVEGSDDSIDVQNAENVDRVSGNNDQDAADPQPDNLLSPITTASWFPAFEKGVPETVLNVLACLLGILRSADSTMPTKIEATKGLLYLYHTFPTGFDDPIAQLIVPQQVAFEDAAWQVRTQMCANMVGYDLNHPAILTPLIKCLADDNSSVKYAFYL